MPPLRGLERAKINHELKKMGFGGIDDPNTFAQIATLYTTHDSFRGLLMSTMPGERQNAYAALRPHLCFTPKPLDVYEMEIKQKAEREQWDIFDGTAYPKPFKVGEVESDEYRLERLANETIQQVAHEKAGGQLELVCTKCTKAEYFPAATVKQARRDSEAKGWRADGTKIWCPDHVPTRLTMTLTCTECERTERVRAWDEQDGYHRARIAGWVINEACVCRRCAAPKITLQ